MKSQTVSIPQQREQYLQESIALRQTFERTGDGSAAVRRRSLLVDQVVRQIYASTISTNLEEPGIALIATGGFGRKELFPYSDIDVLFLLADDHAEQHFRESIRACNQAMWDVGLRASPAIRHLKECTRFDPENMEFTLSLLDRRFLVGDYDLARKLQNDMLPEFVLREWTTITGKLAEAARVRHTKYGSTIFHLEPNIKECPGGLRDYHLAQWLIMLQSLQETRSWPKPTTNSFYATHNDAESAFDFLSATRCFLHFRCGRDDNTLDWHAQDEAASLSIGLETRGTADPAYWMRTYYRHARSVFRRATLLLDALPPARRSFYRQFRRRRTPIAGTDFFLEQGRIDLDETAMVNDADGILRVFGLIAMHGYRLSQIAEDRIADALPVLAIHMPEGPFLWNCLREILLGPYAAHALRTMHALGILELLIPEFHGIDSLVIRDSYHRYTVDEHTFLVIDNVHTLRQPRFDWEQRFAGLLPEIERLDLFFLAVLLHDTGKARRSGDHTVQSVELADSLLARLEFDAEEKDTVRRIIRNHLEMSAAMRRDVFDAESIRAFAEKAGSQQHLKMLCLLTYADIKAVHPDALTPWKAETLWQLYISTSNFLDRNVDEARYHVASDPGLLHRIVALVPDHKEQLRSFLEGLPQRYLQTRAPEQVRQHFQMSLALAANPVQLAFRSVRQLSEVTLITPDRPMLFADMAGALSAWGMNIVKADAFSNDAGLIVDSFQFTDPYRTLELNPSEIERFLSSLGDLISHRQPLDKFIEGRLRGARNSHNKVDVQTHIQYDNESSSHSTLLQVVAQDGPGLLREIARTLAALRLEIQVALIDTEGEIAIDVFYLTAGGAKIGDVQQTELTAALTEALNKLRLAPVS